MTDTEKSTLHQAAETHIQSIGSTLWGQAFEVNSQAGREEAALWLVKQIRATVGHLRPLMSPSQASLLETLEHELSGLVPPIGTQDLEEYRQAALLRATAPVTGWTGARSEHPPLPPPPEQWEKRTGW